MRPQSAADWYALIKAERERAISHRNLQGMVFGAMLVLGLLAGLGLALGRYKDAGLTFKFFAASVPWAAMLVYFLVRGKQACCPACQYNWEFKLREMSSPGVDVWEECPQCLMPLRYPALEQWVAWHT